MVAALLLLAGCGADPVDRPVDVEITHLSEPELLTRVSLDLRGVRPSAEDVAAVEADPAALDGLIDTYLHDPRLGDRIVDLFSEVYLTKTETLTVSLSPYDIDDVPLPDVYRSIGEEPLRVLAEIAVADLPVTELVTADWTMANEVTARLWPLDYPAGETGWKRARYTDGRPAAGVLSGTALWWRYGSTDSNANRKRANAVSRIFLCNDYLSRPISFDRNVNLLDTDALSDALRSNPGCVNCHASLDPLAAYFFGFWTYDPNSADAGRYHPSRERQWETYLGTPPAYYGEPASGLGDLGWQIAADHRYPECFAQRTTELLLRRDAGLLDFGSLARHRDALIAGGLTLRPLLRSIVDSDEYRAADDTLPTAAPTKLVTPELLQSQVEDLTGFRWTSGGYDLMLSEAAGFLTLAGGADGSFVTRSARTPNTTLLLVVERLAEAAAEHVVVADAADPAGARLFRYVDFTETPQTDRAAMAEQIRHLHVRVFGRTVAADGPEVEANLLLWSELYAVDADPLTAWSGLLSALLRDPDFLLY